MAPERNRTVSTVFCSIVVSYFVYLCVGLFSVAPPTGQYKSFMTANQIVFLKARFTFPFEILKGPFKTQKAIKNNFM